MVIWLCGLSGAGKSTIGALLYSKLKMSFPNLVLLDGDELRSAYNGRTGYTKDDRDENSTTIANLCAILDSQNIHVIVCAVTISQDAQKLNRDRFSAYFEIFVDATLDTLKARDPKGIYAAAVAGEIKNVAGVDQNYAPPANPHLAIDNNIALSDVSLIVDKIISTSGILSTKEQNESHFVG